MIRAILVLLTFLVSGASRAQDVGSRTYGTMLKTLLDHSVPEISVSEVDVGGSIFLDARESNEFDVSKMNEAQWVGYDDFSLDRVSHLPKDCKIVVYCSVGYRSEKVAEKLIDAGYKNVSNLYGGIFEWVNTGQPVVDSKDQKTNDIHAYNKIWGVWLNKGNKVYN